MATPPPEYFHGEEDTPPPYNEATEQQPPLQAPFNEFLVDNTAVTTEVQETIAQYNNAPVVTLRDYLVHPHSAINNKLNMMNSIKGLIDILYSQPKLPWKLELLVVYKLNLFFYYFINFIYLIVACAIQGEHVGYYGTYIIIVFLGLIHETFELSCGLYPYIKKCYVSCRRSSAVSPTSNEPQGTEEIPIAPAFSSANNEPQRTEGNTDVPVVSPANSEPQPTEENTNVTTVPHSKKTKNVLKQYLLHSVGELLIFPCLICSLYGYVNEKSW